jgi:thioester reductase-like protein
MTTDETIFLTGFPGFIAGRLIERLARDGARFLLLVQPAFADRARTEIARLAAETNASADRFRIVEGDITRAQLGMSATAFATAREEATTIFHLAAIYDLGVERDPATRINVGGTQNVNEFARGVRRLRRYHYVSTRAFATTTRRRSISPRSKSIT